MTIMQGEFHTKHYEETYDKLRDIVYEYYGGPVDYDIQVLTVTGLTARIHEYTISGAVNYMRGEPVYEVDWKVRINAPSGD